MSLAFIPVYIKFLGIESYGLIGFFASFQSLLALLDLGLGAAISRELARLSVDQGNASQMRSMLRTLELIYWSVSGALAILIFLLAPWLANHWLQMDLLTVNQARHAIILMGLTFAARWPFALYSGVLLGLQRQVLFNAVKVILETVRNAGAAIVLWLVSASLDVFLLWQLLIAALASLAIAGAAWYAMPEAENKPRFELSALRSIWEFAAGLTGIAVTVVVLTQIDKLVLSRMLSLKEFGYYALAWSVAGGLGQLISPVFSAFYPRLTQAILQTDENLIRKIYHQGCQLMSLVIVPVALTLAFFSSEILQIWTQNPDIAKNAHLILSIVIVGTMLNGLMNMPYALQLAYGWTGLAFKANLIAICLLVPLVIVGAGRFGAVGAASVWVVLNAGYVLFSIHWQHRHLLPTEKHRWYWIDVLPVVMLVVFMMLIAREVLQSMAGVSQIVVLLKVLLVYVVSVMGSMLILPECRIFAISLLRRRSLC